MMANIMNPFGHTPPARNAEPSPGHEIPRISFGLEQEFNFAVKKAKFQAYDSNTPAMPVKALASDASSSQKTGSEKGTFLASHLTYLWHLLSHDHPHFSNYKTPCVMCPVHQGDAKTHPYDKFTLVLDDSVMPKWKDQLEGIWGIDVDLCKESWPHWQKEEERLQDTLDDRSIKMDDFFKSIKEDYDRVGAELVSKVLDYDDEHHWMACLMQIQNDLKWDEEQEHGAFMDDGPHLHIHMSLAGMQSIPLRTVQNVILLYGLFEAEIERWHPASQRENFYCWSMRKATAFDPYTPDSYAENIYRIKRLRRDTGLKMALLDWENIRSHGVMLEQLFYNWSQVNISLPREQKPMTLEFRHHRGTLCAEEIRWWTMFCASLLHYAHTLSLNNVKIANPVAPSKAAAFDFVLQFTQTSILEHLCFSAEGIRFFKAKEKEYFDEHSERRSAFNAKVVEERQLLRLNHPNWDNQALEREMQNLEWYKSAVAKYQTELESDWKEQRRLYTIERKSVEYSLREKVREKRLKERRQAKIEARKEEERRQQELDPEAIWIN